LDWIANCNNFDNVPFSAGFKMCPQKTRLLLVEDNEWNADMLSRRLQRRGFDVVIARDGEQGVALAGTENPDLILMDLSLPNLSGWDATQKLKQDPLTQNIPVIALTAHALVHDESKALQAGCDDYDTKPIELPRLLQKIEKAIGRSLS